MTQQEKALQLHQAHQQKPLVLPNVWNAASAKIIENTGVKVIATTSAGIAWSCGFPDGQLIGRVRMLQALREIVNVTDLPVTADIESGYGTGSTEDIRQTIAAILEAGIVGINLEDTSGHDGHLLLDPATQAQRIQTARETAQTAEIDLFINARIDTYLTGSGEPETRLSETIDRAKTYLEAGADGIFVPGVADSETIEALVNAFDAPLNIMAGPGALSISALKDLGVTRISMGPSIPLAVLSLIQQATHEILINGTYHSCETRLTFQEINDAFNHAN